MESESAAPGPSNINDRVGFEFYQPYRKSTESESLPVMQALNVVSSAMTFTHALGFNCWWTSCIEILLIQYDKRF